MPLRTDYARYPRDVREKQNVTRPAGERRLADLHLTAYPSVLNSNALAAADSSETPPKPVAQNKPYMEKPPVELMTTNQLTALLSKMAKEEALKDTTKGTPLGGVECTELDRKTTYRLDYCNKDVPGFHTRQRVIPDYMKNWTETEKDDIREARKYPYLSIPQSVLNCRPTTYRRDYIPTAQPNEYRTLSHKTNLQDMPPSFAYSTYALDDPRRIIKYDEVVAACSKPKCMLWKSYSPRDSFRAKTGVAKDVAEELRLLQELRGPSNRSSESSSVAGKQRESSVECKKPILLPGLRGMGYRMAPGDGKEYIWLPRDHFCHRIVYDY
ncbi:uncharacterized protein TEOVI_000525600 [Trypanosoma equiperdum]|uniref:Uncharacterized protein n=4 Tax=Trypanozoon TaxID=39700 RepID=Q38AQ1_TRYB2|nr:hypothetical protein, conserved [Trypanosoma brucei gambiense DAL972]XP_822947.1 hypothetical protein, conserved [Trypanosoma brucei brucei TREU927]RHW69777.1 hypothetical protein DPX39_100077400 [Trypanosoma brucei equiperdum]SCU68801.1 hypothetical protein, conserved [Trypanosoma equiperdum]EAN78119.1 hypothetical protein, conserved [Trypanosoma brucei brucei TREU927]CBH15780.1 hypothetical protein, conserved [Trypanosoma brucei gambiense DAL972]|eukprot:XP_011778044.1 hypothetical protein, conserved [Trypanosoma brucei gambiense DAL972]